MSRLHDPVAARAGERCEYCRAPEEAFNFPFEVEHIVPRSRGGGGEMENLALACAACNLFKSDAQTGPDEETGTEAPLFHPRRDDWYAHFRVDAETMQIIGLTPTGRATIARLQMNRFRQVRARRRWGRERLFP